MTIATYAIFALRAFFLLAKATLCDTCSDQVRCSFGKEQKKEGKLKLFDQSPTFPSLAYLLYPSLLFALVRLSLTVSHLRLCRLRQQNE